MRAEESAAPQAGDGAEDGVQALVAAERPRNLREDHSAPIVAVQVWYHVGSKDDPPGQSGFAHFFEHIMFNGNEHMTPDMFDNLTENIGGENNAYTADNVTVYHETVPSNYLNPILWAEAERMSAVALNDKNFASERDVVKEEDRQRIRANPYGEFYLNIRLCRAVIVYSLCF